MSRGAPSIRTYLLVAAALMVLLVATIAAAMIDLGKAAMPVAMAIAGAKAILVAVFFMHLKYDTPVARVFAVAGLLWLTILIAGTLDDFVKRY